MPRGLEWAAVQILGGLTYVLMGPLHAERIASLCQQWAQTFSRQRNSITATLKHYAVDTVRKAWTVLAVYEQYTFIKSEIHKQNHICYGQRVDYFKFIQSEQLAC